MLVYINLSSPLNKMAAIPQNILSVAFSWMESFGFFYQITLKFVPKGPIVINPAFVQIMAWRLIGNKPLSKPMLTWFTDPYMWH